MVGGVFELSRENFGNVFINSTSLICNDEDEWLESPILCGNDTHEGVYLSHWH